MTISIESNTASLSAKRKLDEATSNASRIFERLSSGLRINRASDDAAGLAISASLKAHSRVYAQGIRNINDGQSLLSIADSTLSDLSGIVIRLRELSEQAANGSFSTTQRKSLDVEAQELAREYFRISRSARFNGLRLFDGSLVSGLRLQAGFGTDGGIQSSLGGKLGNGNFQSAVSFANAGSISNAVAVGDLNADGNLDMVTAGDGGAYVRLGNGDGTFRNATNYATASAAVSLGDINRDGILDLVTAGSGATIRLGNGNGTFRAATSYSMDSLTSRALELADLNGDGNLDLVTAGLSASGGTATIRLGTGSGTFGAARSYVTEVTTSNALSIGDINGDGILDLVTAGIDGTDGSVTARLGVGNGTFGTATSYTAEVGNGGFSPVGYSPGTNAITLRDVNGDGKLDLITAGAAIDDSSFGTNGYATVRLGTGNGTFGAATSYLTEEGWASYALSVIDVNGDGVLDLITAGTTASTEFGASGLGITTVRLGRGDGTFAAALSNVTANPSALFGIALGDFNGDGVLDLASAGQDANPNGFSSLQLGGTREGINPLLSFSLKTQADALQSMNYFDRTISNLANQRGIIGAFQSRLSTALANLQSTRENITIAESRISNTDIASDAAALVRTQILQQTGTAVMAQANQLPALALLLLQ